MKNLKRYGLLSADNILSFDLSGINTNAENGPSENDDKYTVSVIESNGHELKALPSSATVNAEIIPANYLEIPIPLKSGKAVLRIPENATPEDYDKISAVVLAYK